MIRKFKSPGFTAYFFDDTNNTVYSTKRSGPPKALTWTYSACQGRVALRNSLRRGRNGHAIVTMTLAQVLRATQVVAQPVAWQTMPEPKNLFDILKHPQPEQVKDSTPDGDYILFSESDKVSQYFESGTSIKTAVSFIVNKNLAEQPRNMHVLTVSTGKINKLNIKVVETYTLD